LGVDAMTGGNGIDTISVADATSGQSVDLQAGTASGGDTFSGFENITGSEFDDTLFGDTGANTIYGMGGNDTLTGRGGVNILDGGAGTDIYTAINAMAAQIVDLSTGIAGTNTLISIENVLGSAFNDTLTGDGNANVLTGNAGLDTINGGGGNDLVSGGNDNDILNGGDGDDTVIGGSGVDSMTGGNGIDTISVADATSAQSVDLQAGTATGGDTLSGFENIIGSAFDDTLFGDTGANTIYGMGGNDTMAGRGGVNILDGGAGTDTYTATNAMAAQNIDLSTGIAGTNTLISIENVLGSAFGDTLTGDGNANALTGNAGIDTLNGGGGNDTLSGGNDGDTLTGGDGDDTIIGGTGDDTYRFGRNDDADLLINFGQGASSDRVLLGASVDTDQLWFSQLGNNLLVQIIGTNDQVTIADWYLNGTANQVSRFEVSDGQSLLAADVQNLVSAMAAYSPPAFGDTELSQDQHNALDSVLAANWN
jgi:Ca2+-binding RTX toxin-like protein